MHKTLTFNGAEVKAASNAFIPHLYRDKFGRDIMMELQKFETTAKKSPEELDFAPIERLAWLMLKEGGEDVGESPEEWLRSIDSPVAVYNLSAELLAFWKESQHSTSVPKKK